MNNHLEYIICAAIHYPDLKVKLVYNPKNIQSGVVVCGRRHHNIIELASLSIPKSIAQTSIEGFLTSQDRFVDRKEALIIAQKAEQIRETPKIWFKGDNLYSEDLY